MMHSSVKHRAWEIVDRRSSWCTAWALMACVRLKRKTTVSCVKPARFEPWIWSLYIDIRTYHNTFHGHHCQPKKKKWNTTNYIYTPPSLRANSHTHLYTWFCCTHSRQSRYEHLALKLSFSELILVLLRSQYLRGLLLIGLLILVFAQNTEKVAPTAIWVS